MVPNGRLDDMLSLLQYWHGFIGEGGGVLFTAGLIRTIDVMW